ncbi:hypothetical protein [Roseibium sp. MMSF_3412]|uniref:hypothetical protein n=1 Tax=Roseibium sp. MMSF_3412 TaxID=3046712 RepID=UPI00273E57CC|nr:hypothetical protein [Roseibium sp. MMSF_3412]
MLKLNEREFLFGGLTENAKTQKLPSGWVVHQLERGVAFVVFDDGAIFLHDCEDEAFKVVGDSAVFYSDAGLSAYRHGKRFDCLFNDLNQYFTNIDFQEIDRVGVRFEFGSGFELVLSVSDIVNQIGRMDTSNLWEEKQQT